tara:strand:- start:602 stop:1060 length:459 start_codon:yes stop_codon:yes gene_type:complete
VLRQDNVLEILDLPRETFRYWRARLTPLARRERGHNARYSTGELLGLMCVQLLVEEHDRPVSRVKVVATPLFDQCRHQHWPELRDKCMFVNFVDRRILLSPSLNERPAGSQPSDDVLMIGELVAQIEALIHAEPEATIPGFSSVSIQSRWVQ